MRPTQLVISLLVALLATQTLLPTLPVAAADLAAATSRTREERGDAEVSAASEIPESWSGTITYIAALRAAGARVSIASTYRPRERAYLMHWAWRIARENYDPRRVPRMAGVDICWVHPGANGQADLRKSRLAALQMVRTYRIVFRPALESRHTQRRAIDMTITWRGTLTMRDGRGRRVQIASTPRSGSGNAQLWAVGRTYGVRKLTTDPPHWSDNGG